MPIAKPSTLIVIALKIWRPVLPKGELETSLHPRTFAKKKFHQKGIDNANNCCINHDMNRPLEPMGIPCVNIDLVFGD